MSDVLSTINARVTPQSEPAGNATARNSAGGYVFTVDDYHRLRRFLILGTDGSTYYTSARDLTRDNADVVIRLAKSDPKMVVDTVVSVSVEGLAPRQNPAVFALAAVAGLADEEGRAYALSQLSRVCRTGTHLAMFVGYVEQFRGWGPALKRAVARWYTAKDADKLAYQMLKYRTRTGWAQRDILRMAHPKAPTAAHDALFAFAVSGFGEASKSGALGLVDAFAEAQTASPERIVELIGSYDLSREMLPTEALAYGQVWEALLAKGMPQGALVRQLSTLARLGVTDGHLGALVAEQLADADRIAGARLHPIQLLVAQKTYASGSGFRNSWTPDRRIVDALDSAFYAAFKSVEPSGTRTLLALDVSVSMGWNMAGGLPITCREAVAAVSLPMLTADPATTDIIGFTGGRDGVTALDISPRRRLDDVCAYMDRLPMGGTDCALPMTWAAQAGRDYDTVVVLTDNETWSGRIHPHQALRKYRDKVGHDVKFVVGAMTPTPLSISDPADTSSMDVAGVDSSVPKLIADFAAGRV